MFLPHDGNIVGERAIRLPDRRSGEYPRELRGFVGGQLLCEGVRRQHAAVVDTVLDERIELCVKRHGKERADVLPREPLRERRVEEQQRDESLLRARGAGIVVAQLACGGLHIAHGIQRAPRLLPARTAVAAFTRGVDLDAQRVERGVGLGGDALEIDVALDRVVDGGEQLGGGLQIGDLLFGRVVIRGVRQPREPVLEIALRAAQELGKLVRAVFADELVRILAVRHAQDADVEPRGFEDVDAARGRLLPGGVGVVDEHDVFRVGLDQPRLLRRQRGAEGGDGGAEARLMERDDVHIAFGEQNLARTLVFDKIHRKKVAPLRENRRFRRVEVLRLRIVHHAPAEADDVAAQGEDGKHHAVAEAVIDASLASLDEEPRLEHVGFLVALRAHRVHQRVPAVRRKAEPEAADGVVGKPAAAQIGKPFGAGRGLQCRVKEACGVALEI